LSDLNATRQCCRPRGTTAAPLQRDQPGERKKGKKGGGDKIHSREKQKDQGTMEMRRPSEHGRELGVRETAFL